MSEKPPVKKKKTAAQIARESKPYYVNNKEFSIAVRDYKIAHDKALEAGQEPPQMSEYIGDCIIRIVEGIASKYNYHDYTYIDMMKADAIATCVRAVTKFKYDHAKTKKTRSGIPNAFAYFHTCVNWTFWQRIAKEKRNQEMRNNLIKEGEAETFITPSETNTFMERRFQNAHTHARQTREQYEDRDSE